MMGSRSAPTRLDENPAEREELTMSRGRPRTLDSGSIWPPTRKEPFMVEVPKITIVERIRNRSGPEAADSANDELPEKLDLDSDSDARLLRHYDIEPDELREEFGGGSPSTG